MPHDTADPSRRLPKLAPQTRLVIVFGDQLDLESALVRSIRAEDTVLMMEVAGESRHVPSHVPEEFAGWADGRSSLTMEFFYREQRRKTGYLMEGGSAGKGKTAKPIGGVWNFDKENRLPFGKTGPDPRPRPPLAFAPDETTRSVLGAMRRVLPDLPGRVESLLALPPAYYELQLRAGDRVLPTAYGPMTFGVLIYRVGDTR